MSTAANTAKSYIWTSLNLVIKLSVEEEIEGSKLLVGGEEES